jgi:hypothetical protein
VAICWYGGFGFGESDLEVARRDGNIHQNKSSSLHNDMQSLLRRIRQGGLLGFGILEDILPLVRASV